MGCSFRDWYKFNVHQRIHQNYIEGISLATTGVVAAGLVKGNYGFGVGLAYMIGRYYLFVLDSSTLSSTRRRKAHSTLAESQESHSATSPP